MKYRNKKTGKFVSHRHVKEMLNKRSIVRQGIFFIMLPFVLAAIGLVMMSSEDTFVIENVSAHEIEDEASDFESLTDLCGLEVVTCENEPTDVEKAIQAVETSLKKEITQETKNRIQYLKDLSVEYGFDFFDGVKTVYCESEWYCVKSNSENSWCLPQINRDFHDITDAQANDAYFSLKWMAQNWNKKMITEDGEEWDGLWYAYDRSTGQCTNKLRINL